jgi:hypothetical protein
MKGMAMAKSKSDGGNGAPVNKSAAIREAIAQHPQARSKEIIALLGARGIKVRPTLVYYIKSKEKHEKWAEKRKRATATSQRAGAGSPVDLIIKVRNLANEAGGLRYLKQLVDILAE